MISHGGGDRVMKAASPVVDNTDRTALTVTLFIGFFTAFLFLYVVYLKTLKRLRASRVIRTPIERERKDLRLSVSIFVNDLMLRNGSAEINQDSVAPLADLANACDLYLFMQVDDESNIATILSGLEQCEAFKGGLKKHRVLFSSTSAGRASMVRQLQPLLHMESNIDVVKVIQGKIANLLKFKVTQGNGDQAREGEDDVLHVNSAAQLMTVVQPLIITS